VNIDFLGVGRAILATARAADESAYDGRCNPLDFNVGAHAEPALDGGGNPIGRIERLVR
jgi:hypothetical protein